MQYRKNRSKARIQHHLWYQKNKNNPAFKRRQKMRRQHPNQFRMRRGSGGIGFVMGADMELGCVLGISPEMESVEFCLEGQAPTFLPVGDFLKSVVFLSPEEADETFNLIDTFIGLGAYRDWSESDEVGCKVASKMPLTEEAVEQFRKDFLTITKNVGKPFSVQDLQRWRDAVIRWRERFNRFGAQIQEDLKGRIRVSEGKPEWEQKFNVGWATEYLSQMSTFWHLSSIFNDIPVRSYQYILEQDKRMWGTKFTPEQFKERAEAEVLRKWMEDSPVWGSKAKRRAVATWKFLKDLISWTMRGGGQGGGEEPIVLNEPTVRNLTLEGFHVQFVGFEEADESVQFYLPSLKEGLAKYKERASRVLPWLIKYQLPLKVIWSGDSDNGEAAATYEKNHITLKFFGLAADRGRMTHVIAHEMGHHIWQNVLPEEAKNVWADFIRGDYKELDLRTVLKGMKPGETVSEFGYRIETDDPILSIQIESLSNNPTYKGYGIYSATDVWDHLLHGKDPIVHVPTHPITGYASKNKEEAFCEALGKIVAWGPRTVPDPVSWILKVIMPNLRMSSMAERVATAYRGQT